MMTLDRFSRTIPQRLQATFTPVSDASFDDVLARLAAKLGAHGDPSSIMSAELSETKPVTAIAV